MIPSSLLPGDGETALPSFSSSSSAPTYFASFPLLLPILSVLTRPPSLPPPLPPSLFSPHYIHFKPCSCCWAPFAGWIIHPTRFHYSLVISPLSSSLLIFTCHFPSFVFSFKTEPVAFRHSFSFSLLCCKPRKKTLTSRHALPLRVLFSLLLCLFFFFLFLFLFFFLFSLSSYLYAYARVCVCVVSPTLTTPLFFLFFLFTVAAAAAAAGALYSCCCC